MKKGPKKREKERGSKCKGEWRGGTEVRKSGTTRKGSNKKKK